MLSVIIQPKTFKNTYQIADIERVVILKFSHKPMFENDYAYTVLYDSSNPDKECLDIINKNINDDNLITYNGKMLCALLDAIDQESDNYSNEYADKIVGLMEYFAELHSSNGRWWKLERALEFYDYNADVDTSDPMDMAIKSLILYRLMVKNDDL